MVGMATLGQEFQSQIDDVKRCKAKRRVNPKISDQ